MTVGGLYLRGPFPMENTQHTISDNYILELTLYTKNGEVNLMVDHYNNDI